MVSVTGGICHQGLPGNCGTSIVLLFQPLKAQSNACHYRGWLVLVSTNPFVHLDSDATCTCNALWFGLWNRWQKALSWEQRKGRVHVAPPSAASSLPHSTGAGVFTQAVSAILLPYFLCVPWRRRLQMLITNIYQLFYFIFYIRFHFWWEINTSSVGAN